MADYSVSFSSSIEAIRAEEREWLGEMLQPDETQARRAFGTGSWPDFEGEFQDRDGTCRLWVHADERGDVGNVALLVHRFLRKFRPEAAWSMSWAETCSKPRIDEFGGGAVFVTAHSIEWMHTGSWIRARHEREVRRRTKMRAGRKEAA